MLDNYTEVAPAYGRDYKSGKAAKADFLAGKDFVLTSIQYGGSLCSKRDFAKGTTVLIRLKRLENVTSVKAP